MAACANYLISALWSYQFIFFVCGIFPLINLTAVNEAEQSMEAWSLKEQLIALLSCTKGVHPNAPNACGTCPAVSGQLLLPVPPSCWLRLGHLFLWSLLLAVVVFLWFTLGALFWFACLYSWFQNLMKACSYDGCFPETHSHVWSFLSSLQIPQLGRPICTGVKLWDKTMWRQIPLAFSSRCLQWYRTKLNWGRISYKCSSCKASDPSLLLSIVSYCWL